MGTFSSQSLSLKDGSPVVLRMANDEDAAALLKMLDISLRDGAGQVAVPGEMNVTAEEEASWIKKINDNSNDLLLVVEHLGCIVGLLDFHIGERKRLSHRGVFGISVLPNYRSRGIGTVLLQALIDWAQGNGNIEKIALAVRADNQAAIGLYQKLGFFEEGRRIKEIKLAPGIYVDDVLMYRWVGG